MDLASLESDSYSYYSLQLYGCSSRGKAYLNEPDDIVRAQLVLDHPGSQYVPLHSLAPIDGDAILCMLILAGLQVHKYLFCQLCKEAAMQQVVLQ